MLVGVKDPKPWHKTRHRRLLDNAEHPGDQGLRSDDRRHGRYRNIDHLNDPVNRRIANLRRQSIESVRPRWHAAIEHISDLTGITKDQTRQHDHEPRVHHRQATRQSRFDALATRDLRITATRKMPDVGILGLSTGDRKDHDSENHQRADLRETRKKPNRIGRIDRQENIRMGDHPWQTLQGDPRKPNRNHKPTKNTPYLARPPPLHLKEDHQAHECQDDRDWNPQWFKGTEHAYRRGDDPVGSQETCGTDDQKTDGPTGKYLAGVALQKTQQRKRTTFAPMIRSHDDQVILDC